MKVKTTMLFIIPALLLVACGGPVEKTSDITSDEKATTIDKQKQYSPYAGNDIPRNVYWGDTHLHTKLSPDANLTGNGKLGPEDAFRFASGYEVTTNKGMQAKLQRPLDFLVVTDHAEYMGLLPGIAEGNEILMASDYGKDLAKQLQGTEEDKFNATLAVVADIGNADAKFRSKEFEQTVWQTVTAAADKYNDPGKFTAFIGYEFTSMPKVNNLHRCVIFKDDASYADQIVPFSAFDSENPEDLWVFLQGYEDKTGGNVLAIAHNGNVSNGLMFMDEDYAGKPLTKEYAETRMKWEPLYEVTQIKGDGETHPMLSPKDEFADFETWDWGNLDATIKKEEAMLKHEYARSALKLGLQLETKLGVNPYKFGLQGASDAHSSLAGEAENNYWGKLSMYEPGPERAEHDFLEKSNGRVVDKKADVMGAAGYTGVWAKENTRAAIFEAMERKEVYATTGPRMTVRLFGGWDFTKADVYSASMSDIGYQKGVPMGGNLVGSESDAPTFMVVATKDVTGANLDRVQIVKGWEDANGEVHEKVYNVALSDDRKLSDNPKPVGNTVDLKNATYSNSIGDAELTALWVDPNFDASQDAFYYVRVLEIPTPRWTAYDAKFFGTELSEDGPPNIIQERAYTSPIWYTPKN
ncbi:hypothetical protein A9Q87_01430 [Flavobacteriales bacterium 34_180_T64]|mgnify:CR=1 FL=1|nr:hypothetical protein A9Q87_01430 [Flavobacteriales bacterium 34_180_T64]